jgi:CRP/FNR family transcriptional regulator
MRPHEHLQWSIPQTTCRICLAFNICSAAAGVKSGSPQQSGHLAAARRNIRRGHDLHDAVPFICSGWAATVVALSDGRRQITSFLLPGDIISTTLLFDSQPHCRIEAVTEVHWRTFNRIELQALLQKHPGLLDKLLKTWVDEKTRADGLIADLGRRTAEERIARMICNLFDRLAKPEMVRGEPLEIDFPLRQHHIADATGLTPVHVSRVFTEFRRSGLINISKRSLTLIDPEGLKRIADMRWPA